MKLKEEIVFVNQLKHKYPDSTEIELSGLPLTIQQGERVVILGHNGSGKTTLLNHIMGLLEASAGQISVFGCNPKKEFKTVRKRLGVVFQNPEEQIIGPTVYEDISFTLMNSGLLKADIEIMVKEIMLELGIWHLREKIPHYLSGGEKKKVALAGAMVQKPELLILDEPFTGLDPKSRLEMVKIINSMNAKYGTAVLLTTHEMDLINLFADQVYILTNSKFICKGKPEEVLCRVDLLTEAGLEPPVLVDLFIRLAAEGIPVSPVIWTDAAVKQLAELYKEQQKKFSRVI